MLIHLRHFRRTDTCYEVLQRNLPKYYPYNNAYTYWLFFIPTLSDRISIEKSGLTFNKHKRRPIHTLSDRSAIQHVFSNPNLYHTLYADSLATVTDGYG